MNYRIIATFLHCEEMTPKLFVYNFRIMGCNGIYCTKGTQCSKESGNNIDDIERGFVTDRTTEYNFKFWKKIAKKGKIDYKSKFHTAAVCLQSLGISRFFKICVFCTFWTLQIIKSTKRRVPKVAKTEVLENWFHVKS